MTRRHSFCTTWIAEREGLHQQLTMSSSENVITGDLSTGLASGTNPSRTPKSRSIEYPWEIYSLKELLQATNNFNDSNKLGEGGFGTVYWGRTAKGVEWAAPLVDRRKWERIADPRLAGRFDAQQLRAVVEAAMLCTQSNAESRPAMAEVVEMLRFSGERRTTKEIVPVVSASSELTTPDLQDVTCSSEPLDRRS
ncbi:unnamed protein product [Miscanthus lutarioriparius]|uniref:Uncharacterized protein n=1 Tax=Miscanthus lutarioriparius TaxID=422564 RepID=A0A811NKK4_9POAL|nr:unnamed protein product [Miscanthus lutarioriparius]